MTLNRPEVLNAINRRMASLILHNAPLAVRYTKEAIHQGMDLTLEEGLALEASLGTILATTEDAREGPRAFAEKREPRFTGR